MYKRQEKTKELYRNKKRIYLFAQLRKQINPFLILSTQQ